MNKSPVFDPSIMKAVVERAIREKGQSPESQNLVEQFCSQSLPVRGSESWKYTPLSFLKVENFAVLAEDEDKSWVEEVLAGLTADECVSTAENVVVILNGRFQPHYSRVSKGLEVEEMPWKNDKAQSEFWRKVTPATDHVLLSLNEILATHILSIKVKKDQPMQRLALLELTRGRKEGSIHPHYSFDLAEATQLEVVEVAVGKGPYLHNGISKVKVRKEAIFSLTRAARPSEKSVSLDGLYADIEEKGEYSFFTSVEGAYMQRTDIKVGLNGTHAIAHVNGVQLLGAQAHGDITSYISHAAQHTASRQTVKNVLAQKARGVFQGKIFVDRIAQKTDGYQMNQALLLSEGAEIDAKPELEIYADDVKCSHGATAGALDEEQLFYLRSRGLPLSEAKKMLVNAFIADAFALVKNESVRQFINKLSHISLVLAE